MHAGRLVRLRELRMEDAETIRGWLNDAETARMATGGSATPKTLVGMQDWVRKHRHDSFLAETIADGAPVGVCTYQGLDRVSRSCRLGFLVGESAARGRGYGTDMALLLLDYLFRERDLARVNLYVLAENAPAVHLYEKLGFTLDEAGGRCAGERGYFMTRETYAARFG